jgi:hypothetical protein
MKTHRSFSRGKGEVVLSGRAQTELQCPFSDEEEGLQVKWLDRASSLIKLAEAKLCSTGLESLLPSTLDCAHGSQPVVPGCLHGQRHNRQAILTSRHEARGIPQALPVEAPIFQVFFGKAEGGFRNVELFPLRQRSNVLRPQRASREEDGNCLARTAQCRGTKPKLRALMKRNPSSGRKGVR